MKYWLMAASSAFLFGCASRPRVLPYSWGTIVATDGNSLARKCSATPGTWDSGRPKMVWDPVGGCMIIEGRNKKPEFWIEDTDYGWRCVLPHEFAHEDGVSDPKATGYDCNN